MTQMRKNTEVSEYVSTVELQTTSAKQVCEGEARQGDVEMSS